jgi:hypothetical protein
MTLTCAICSQDSGTSLVCPACRPHLNENQKLKLLRTWHRIVVERANCACEDCGHSAPFDSGELCGDHVETQGARPDLKYDVTNGVCRCLPCHNKRHTGELPPKPLMTKEDPKKSPKKLTCKAPRCHMLPARNGYCLLHQPKK